jgi:hypothetical protein
VARIGAHADELRGLAVPPGHLRSERRGVGRYLGVNRRPPRICPAAWIASRQFPLRARQAPSAPRMPDKSECQGYGISPYRKVLIESLVAPKPPNPSGVFSAALAEISPGGLIRKVRCRGLKARRRRRLSSTPLRRGWGYETSNPHFDVSERPVPLSIPARFPPGRIGSGGFPPYWLS